MDGVVGAGDLCRGRELTESSLLASLESRYRDDITESYVGNVLLRVSHYSMVTSQFLPLFCASVVQSLTTSSHDQCIVIYGRQSVGKGRLFTDALADLLLHVDDPYGRVAIITSAMKIIKYLCHSISDEQSTSVDMVTLLVDPTTTTLRGAHISLLLLDTSHLADMQVFQEDGGIKVVIELLLKFGMSVTRGKEVQYLLEAVAALTSGRPVTAILKKLGVQLPRDYIISANKLSQLLYAYLVHWLVLWMNSRCGCDEGPVTSISLLSSPGLSGNRQDERRQLPSMIMDYADQYLLNIYCSRQFVWEQEQYLEEGLEWEVIEVDGNDALVDTFHREGGLLDALSKTSPAEVRGHVQQVCVCSGDSCFTDSNLETFSTVHLTGEYQYDLGEAWLQANDIHRVDDTLRKSFLKCSTSLLVGMAANMGNSPDHILASEPVGQNLLTQRAKIAMETVCDIITSCNPHFIVSVEPTDGPGGSFHGSVVLDQLQELKVLDTCLMQSCGYPVRLSHNKFLENYQVLLGPQYNAHSVMLKPWHLLEMDNAADLYHQSARKLQYAMRRSLLKRRARVSSPNPPEFGVIEEDSALDAKTTPPTPPPRPNLSKSKANSMSALKEETHVSVSLLPRPQEVIQPHPSPPPSPHPPVTSPSHPVVENSSSFTGFKKKNSWKNSTRRRQASPRRSKQSDLKSQVWFLGSLSREEAEECLKAQVAATFMVRESQKRIGQYSLSVSHDNTVKHFRVDTRGNAHQRFQLYGAQRSFSSLEALVDHYSQLCISPRGELLLHPYTTISEVKVKPLKRNLGSIHRPRPEPARSRGGRGPASKHKSKSCDLSVGMDPVEALKKQLEVEERIVEAARRMAELPTGTKRERQKRKQSLQMAQSKLMSIRQEYHLQKQRNLIIEYSMHPILDDTSVLQ